MTIRQRFRRRVARLGPAAVLGLLGTTASVPAEEVPVRWNLSEIYADVERWEAAKREFAGRRSAMERFRGRLGESAAQLREALDTRFALFKELERLGSYASMLADEDTREAGPQGMKQALQSLASEMEAASAWFEPEVLALPPARLDELLAREPGLTIYRRYLERLEKRRPHVLDPAGEEILGMTERITGTGSTVGGLLRNAEIPWPTIRLADGSELRVDTQGFSKGRRSFVRDDRIAAFRAFHGQLAAFQSSLAATLSSSVQEHVFTARVRRYPSSLDASLERNEVDPAVYRMLIDEINASLPTLHRYLALRGRILELPDLAYHDIYPPLVDAVTADYGWDGAKRLVVEALAPLGGDYQSRLAHALDAGWVDVFPRQGKRAGAYVNGSVYDVHPYMLLNHQDDYNSTSTLAHEAGHLMHSWYSNEAQPYPTAGYAIFVAEVASTVNEVLLFKSMLAAAGDDRARLALLGNFLDGLRGTVFRQTQFAEFELAIHEAAERGEPLTGESLNALYLELVRRYHGHAAGVMRIDDAYAPEWAAVPHFHYNFYVYQYATSYVAAIALAEGLLEGRPGARERYLTFLRAGSTRTPVDLLREAGVDMTTPEPIRAAMRLMNGVMDEIEAILGRRG